jgi:hypothetical protein
MNLMDTSSSKAVDFHGNQHQISLYALTLMYTVTFMCSCMYFVSPTMHLPYFGAYTYIYICVYIHIYTYIYVHIRAFVQQHADQVTFSSFKTSPTFVAHMYVSTHVSHVYIQKHDWYTTTYEFAQAFPCPCADISFDITSKLKTRQSVPSPMSFHVIMCSYFCSKFQSTYDGAYANITYLGTFMLR